MERTGVGTLVVVDARAAAARAADASATCGSCGGDARVAERMTPRDRLVVHTGADLAGRRRAADDERTRSRSCRSSTPTARCSGLITAKDLLKHRAASVRDARRARPAARRRGGRRDRRLPRAGGGGAARRRRRARHRHRARPLDGDGAARSSSCAQRFGDVELVAGNVATAEGARFLLERGVNAIKVGIGPGGGCTTRLTTNFGVPQVEALVQCRLAVGDRVPLIADGGIKRARRHRARRCCSAATR